MRAAAGARVVTATVIRMQRNSTQRSFVPDDTKGDTKPYTLSPEILARAVARGGTFFARFITALTQANAALAATITPESALDEGAAPALPPSGSSESPSNPSSAPGSGRALGQDLQTVAGQTGLICIRLSLTSRDLPLEQARTLLPRLAGRVAALGADRGLIACTDLRSRSRGGYGPHVYALGLFGSKAEAEAILAWWRVELEADAVHCRVKPLGEGDPKFRIANFARVHFVRAAGYMTHPWPRVAGKARDPLLDCVAVGSLAQLWAKHRDGAVGAPEGRRCGHCARPLPAVKGTGRPSKFCGDRPCKSAFHRKPKTIPKRDTKPDTAVSCRVDQPEPVQPAPPELAAEPNPTSEFRIAGQALEANADTEPTSEFRVAPLAKPKRTDPIKAAAAFTVEFHAGEETSPAELVEFMAELLAREGVGVPRDEAIEKALSRAMLESVRAA